jgi:hypothetical protein
MRMELAAESKEPAGAPAKEIEITPEMIEAGYDCFREYDYEANLVERKAALAAAFRAMLSVLVRRGFRYVASGRD